MAITAEIDAIIDQLDLSDKKQPRYSDLNLLKKSFDAIVYGSRHMIADDLYDYYAVRDALNLHEWLGDVIIQSDYEINHPQD